MSEKIGLKHHINTSRWYRIRHSDGRWLRMDGEGWIDSDSAYSYLGTTLRAEAMAEISTAVIEAGDEWRFVEVTRGVRGRDRRPVQN